MQLSAFVHLSPIIDFFCDSIIGVYLFVAYNRLAKQVYYSARGTLLRGVDRKCMRLFVAYHRLAKQVY